MSAAERAAVMVAAGLADSATAEWARAEPLETSELRQDRSRHTAFWWRSAALLARLPRKQQRDAAERAAAAAILGAARAARERFLGAHAELVYDELTGARSRFLRLHELAAAAAQAVPGLVPSAAELASEAALDQRDKEGVEIDHGIFFSALLAAERAGLHLCHAMLLPRPESHELGARFAADGVLDLGTAQLERRGKAAYLTAANARVLNAEDDTTLAPMETAVDVATLDAASDVAVLRGGEVTHAKYRGRRVLGAGINLTRLYRGKIPFLWFLERDLGYVHKLFRGVAQPDALPDDVHAFGTEKLWIAAVETFAIGGHCQVLLTMDYVLAASDAFLTLPARKEGIIPGLANLRLPRFVGDRLARQAIQYERKLLCDSPEGRLICDEVALAGEMDEAIERVVRGLTSSGAVGAVGNRRAFRVGAEPLHLFRRYCAVYAREQAHCLFSSALIANLERYWHAQNREL
jgi:(3,5-dihydroxyphenyl)acetyl-CoA 1,2-dioxygenase